MSYEPAKTLQGFALLDRRGRLSLHGQWALFGIRITQVAFYCEVFAEAMQVQVADLGGLAHPGKARACGEGNGSGSGKNSGSVVEKNFVNSVGCESGPVHGGTAFDHDAGDLQFCQAAENRR